MKPFRLLFVLLPFAPLLGLFAPVQMLPESFDPWFLPYTTLLFFLSRFFYLPADSLARTLWFFFPDLSIPLYLRYFLYPACALQSLLLSVLVWRRFTAAPNNALQRTGIGGGASSDLDA